MCLVHDEQVEMTRILTHVERRHHHARIKSRGLGEHPFYGLTQRLLRHHETYTEPGERPREFLREEPLQHRELRQRPPRVERLDVAEQLDEEDRNDGLAGQTR